MTPRTEMAIRGIISLRSSNLAISMVEPSVVSLPMSSNSQRHLWNALKGQGFNLNGGDITLGLVAAQLGSNLKAGKITRGDISSEIQRLCNK